MIPGAVVSSEVFYFAADIIHGGLQVRYEKGMILDDREICPGLKPPPQPLVMRRRVGVRVYDSIFHGGLMLVSPRFLELMSSMDATGWTSYPVEIYGKDDARIKGYHCLVVTGRDPGIQLVRPLPEAEWDTIHLSYTPCRRRLPDGRLDPEPERPPAYDFIVPETTVAFYISGRVKRACDEAKLRGFRFKPIGWVQRERIEGEKKE